MKKATCVLMILIIVFWGSLSVFAEDMAESSKAFDLNSVDQTRIDTIVSEVLRKSNVPAASIVLLSDDEASYHTYGQADHEADQEVTRETLFEIGSMTKAFTGLAILQLEEQGILSLKEPVTKYIPWMQVHFSGTYDNRKIDQNVELTLENLLYHTSGIPFKTIGYIPEGTASDMLQKTVRMLVGTELDDYPGEKYSYATINYDVLGYIIEIITGESYETYIQNNIIEPLGLSNTYLFQDQAQATGMLSKGYKMTLFAARQYDAPRYRGNTPAGYIISNAVDMERWMRIQLGMVQVPEQLRRIIEKSHVGNAAVAPEGNYHYAVGWEVNIKGNEIRHGGSNPNYSSMMIMRPDDRVGICILTNMDSNAADYLADAVLNILLGKKVGKYTSDSYKNLDTVFSVVIILAILMILFYAILCVIFLIDLLKGSRTRNRLKGAKVAGIVLALPLMVFLGFCIYYLPNIIFHRLPWYAVEVWGSSAIKQGCILGFIALVTFMLYVLLTFNFPQEKEKGYFALIPLSLINGIASAMIIFTINESFNRNLDYSKELLVYFVFAISFFVYTLKLLQGRMIVVTNEITYEKRMSIINNIMSSSYQAIERIGRDRIFSGLNNDCSALAQIPSLLIEFASNSLTLLFCLSYLLTKNIWAFVASLGIILLNGIISFITSRIASNYWEKNRSIQDTYFSQMQDLVNGFKELVLNRRRRREFWLDIKRYSRLSTELNKSASIKFLNFELYNTLMYNLVFGVVVFLFPIMTDNLNVNQLRENLFIVFYMIGPFVAIANTVPRLTQVNVNVKRINTLIADLDKVSTGAEAISHETNVTYPQEVTIHFENVVYKYYVRNSGADGIDSDNEFTLGPITVDFSSREIVFITGGNGSGKSTLGKLITGLYTPQTGKIYINNEEAVLSDQNELFSSVYSDFNLFKKLYGIDYSQSKDVIGKYLDMMRIHEKIEINEDGEILSIDLSTGQRKRLAFVISCLEDKPMMLFDEWAAEQDPIFRRYFYDELLPMLKEQGKGVVVITHDDRYFDRADKLIKLERGTICNI